MKKINQGRLLLGAVVGGVAWGVWSWVVNAVLFSSDLRQAQDANLLLQSPRYPFFLPLWFLLLILLTYVLTWFYTGMREVFLPGPKTALAVGILGGFAIAFPLSFAVAAWVPLDRLVPLAWLVDLWVGAILAAFLAAWLYREG
ncbi:MAG: hypothetical protein NZ869_08935 [Thermoanaerobaculum sp.]|nr:hypothetical protein [Thermoanaerobaculum sp.]MDW7968591.1 hypothetical protein [Thermoanaerobaculum sp.]